MGSIVEKLAYLSDAVDDIQAAINEKGVQVDDGVVLGKYGDKIRAIETGGGWFGEYLISEGVWAFTVEDLMMDSAYDLFADNVITGTVDGFVSRDYISAIVTSSITLDDFIVEDMTDVTSTITIITNTYS